jgi:hypothetical protein
MTASASSVLRGVARLQYSLPEAMLSHVWNAGGVDAMHIYATAEYRHGAVDTSATTVPV